ncbi:hypothetical protein ACFLQL_00630 [Verrucomicrobiota bacterium]
MKKRNNFISNSSSSSFIIAVKKSNPCEHCGRSDPDFINLINRMGEYSLDSDATKVEEEDIEHIISALEEEDSYYPSEPRYGKTLINKILAYKNKPEFKVAQIRISYHDETADKLFNECAKNGSIIILHSEGD